MEEALTTTPNYFLKGSILSGQGHVPINFLPIEVSRFRLLILTDENIDLGKEALTVKTNNVHLQTTVYYIGEHYNKPELKQYALIHKDPNLNFETIIKNLPEFITYKRSTPLRAARFEVHDLIQINAKTFGLRDPFKLACINISKSGLLASTGNSNVPFKVSTIIEMSLDLGGKFFDKPVQCVGKVVRFDHSQDPEQPLYRYGIQFIKMDEKLFTDLIDKIDELEKRVSVPARKIKVPLA